MRVTNHDTVQNCTRRAGVRTNQGDSARRGKPGMAVAVLSADLFPVCEECEMDILGLVDKT